MYRARILPDQIVLLNQDGDFEQADINLNVESDRELRRTNPIGTAFACTRLTVTNAVSKSTGLTGNRYYRTSKEIHVVTGPYNASQVVRNAYKDYQRGLTPQLNKKANTRPAAPQTKSVIDTLLKEHPCPTSATHGFYVDPVKWQRLIFNFSKGVHSMLTGPDGTGKSALAALVAKDLGQPIKIFNMGSKMDPIASLMGVHRHQNKKNGSFFDRADFTYAIESALQIADHLIRSGAIDIIVIDTVAALVPKGELEGEMGESKMGLQARLMSQALRKLTGTLSKTGCACIFINQLREKIGVMFGNPETTTVGNALKFYASVRLDIRRIGQLKEGTEEVVGNRTKVKVVKNKVPHLSKL